jgi:hypothetical protein
VIGCVNSNFEKGVFSMRNKLIRDCCLLACVHSAMTYGSCQDQMFKADLVTGGLFGATICSDGDGYDEVNYSGNSVEGLIDQLDGDELRGRFPGFNEDTNNAFFWASLRGLPIYAAFPNEKGKGDETALVFNVPALDICEVWGKEDPGFCQNRHGDKLQTTPHKSGNSRDANKDSLKDYLKKEGSQILAELVKVSPVDPIAGNPASQQTQMITDEYEAGTGGRSASPIAGLGIGAQFGQFTQGGYDISVYTLPLSYKMPLGKDHELLFRLPLSYTDVSGAKSYKVTLGISYRRYLTKAWSLTPSVSYGVAGSRELGSLAQSVSTSLTSNYVLPLKSKYEVSISNMLGYYKTLPFKIQDYDVDLGITNTILRNGVSLSIPLGMKLSGSELSLETFFVDTRFYGSELYTDQFNEIGFSIGPRMARKGTTSFSGQIFGVGLTYLRSENDHAFNFNVGYRF